MTSSTADYQDVSVVMITRNEELAIGRVISDAKVHLPGAQIFVVDGSDDATPVIAESAGAIVAREPGGGFGPALHAALNAPSSPIIVTVDADDSYPADVFPELVGLIRGGWDVAGTDRISVRPAAMPLSNWVANRIFNKVASWRARTRLRDVHSGQRAYRAAVLKAFNWDHTGLAFPVDLLLWPALVGYRVIEIPITYSERIGVSKLSRWPSGRATLRRLFRRRGDVMRAHVPPA